ncbi:hypothetical protein D3C81_1723510 [compost metagenome]
MQIEIVWTIGSGDFKNVAKACRSNESGTDAPTLRQSIDDYCRAVGEKVDIFKSHLGLSQDVENALLEIRRCGVGLRSSNGLFSGDRIGLEVDQVSESTTDVGSYPYGLAVDIHSTFPRKIIFIRNGTSLHWPCHGPEMRWLLARKVILPTQGGFNEFEG